MVFHITNDLWLMSTLSLALYLPCKCLCYTLAVGIINDFLIIANKINYKSITSTLYCSQCGIGGAGGTGVWPSIEHTHTDRHTNETLLKSMEPHTKTTGI